MLKRSSLKRTGKPLQRTGTLKKGEKLKSKPKSQQIKDVERAQQEAMWEMFELHWNSKSHICENCGTTIWGENKSLYHDHLLEKGNPRYEHLKYEVGNLFLCCWECHTNKGNGYPGEKHKQAIERVKIKYGL